ncbi:hypothetical protein DL96DRAFT_1711347 [Flagelloscypha sp. PMI_526]|nr:hypothetical protein DL96DRAFT_1711347 [Flagelloscypha sp. PMI_526]
MTTLNLKAYPAPQAFLDAISPSVLSTPMEWRLNIPLGVSQERIDNPSSLSPTDQFVAISRDGSLQLVFMRSGNGAPLVVFPTAPMAELKEVGEQLEILVEWIYQQAKDDESLRDKYSNLTTPEVLSTKLIELISKKFAVVDQSTFVPHPPSSPDDVIRQITLNDVDEHLGTLAILTQQFERDTGVSSTITPIPDLLISLKSFLEKGWRYWGYFVSGKLVAAAVLRRPTQTVLAITFVHTADDMRRRGYGSAITSAVVEHALKTKDEGGLGKLKVTLFYDEDKPHVKRVYQKLGFVDGEGARMLTWKFDKPH